MKKLMTLSLLLILLSLLAACGQAADTAAPAEGAQEEEAAGPQQNANQGPANIILGAYTTPREAYGQLIPIFQKQWKEKTGQSQYFRAPPAHGRLPRWIAFNALESLPHKVSDHQTRIVSGRLGACAWPWLSC